MRVLLFTGKGGVGKTSLAAATALATAAQGLSTLVLSTDPAHSLADALQTDVGPEPTDVAPGLQAVQLDAQVRLEENWRDIQRYLVALLRWSGIGEVEAEELSVLPGLEEIFSLVDVHAHANAGEHDVLVVDCAPTAETLRLLTLPDALGWYMERIVPIERKVARVVRPVIGQLVGEVPLPETPVGASVQRLYHRLEGVRDLLADTSVTSVRLVTAPERIVVAETRRTHSYLSLFGYQVDAVIVNRLLPDAVTDPWFDRWKAVQAAQLADIRDAFGDVPVLCAPLFADEPAGPDHLRALAAAAYGDAKPHEILHAGSPMSFERTADGWVLGLALPGVDRGRLDVLHRGDELYVKVDSHTRSVLLPAALRRCHVTRAALDDGRLEVTFTAEEQHEQPR